MVRMLDKGDVMAGGINEQDTVDRAGETKWCDEFVRWSRSTRTGFSGLHRPEFR
jgi:hypothetical protein